MRIPNGKWQRTVGLVLTGLGVLIGLAATPFNAAGGIATAMITSGGTLLFWGITLRYFSILERRIVWMQEEMKGSRAIVSDSPSADE